MIRLDEALLDDLGFESLPAAHKNGLLYAIYSELEQRVGTRLSALMSDQQLRDFEALIDNDDEVGALAWLERNFPDYRDVVADEYEMLLSELRSSGSGIREASSAFRQ